MYSRCRHPAFATFPVHSEDVSQFCCTLRNILPQASLLLLTLQALVLTNLSFNWEKFLCEDVKGDGTAGVIHLE